MAEGNPKIIAVAGSVVIVMMSLGAAMYFTMAPQMPEPPPEVAHAPAPPVVIDSSRPAPAPAVEPGVAEAPSSPSGSARAKPKGPPSASQRMSRDLKREQIWQALRQDHELEAGAAGSAAPPPEQRARLPQLDPEYIQSAIREQLVPVAVECYESALEDEPELAGQLLVEFTIVGAEEVGGVVEDAAIQDESSLENAFVRECIRESVMAVEFEPPEAGGQVKVVYPINFEPE